MIEKVPLEDIPECNQLDDNFDNASSDEDTDHIILDLDSHALLLREEKTKEHNYKVKIKWFSRNYLIILYFLTLAWWGFPFRQIVEVPAGQPSICSKSRAFHETRQNYLTLDYGVASGMCNDLFEFVAGLGIANQLNRIPYIYPTQHVYGVLTKKIYPVFPKLLKQFQVVYWDFQSTTIDKFHSGLCCFYNDTSVLKNNTAEYLHLGGLFFQSFKYFDELRDDIREWLLPNATVQSQAESHLPMNYRSHFVICVHIRRGDFLTDNWHAASEANFSSLALDYLMEKYRKEGKTVAGAILGEDSKWETEVFGGKEDVFVIHNTVPEEFAFTRRYCDVVLITAPSSTFGWFMGYLSKGSNVYYRDIMTTTDKGRWEVVQEDFYLPTWVKIKEENGTIIEVSK